MQFDCPKSKIHPVFPGAGGAQFAHVPTLVWRRRDVTLNNCALGLRSLPRKQRRTAFRCMFLEYLSRRQVLLYAMRCDPFVTSARQLHHRQHERQGRLVLSVVAFV